MPNKILIVDDEPLICQLIVYQLGGAGYDVVTAGSGREALELLSRERPDLLLLDVMMPGLSGWDLCRQIRANSQIPIIMLTAKASDGDIVVGLQSGADDYIAKPFNLAQLLARVEAVLRRSRRAATDGRRLAVEDRLWVGVQSQGAATAHSPSPVEPAPAVSPTLPPVELPPQPPSQLPSASPFLGRRLADTRRARGLSLRQVEQACGIRWEFLQALEREEFSFMSRPQLRHTLLTYSTFLGVDLREFMVPPPSLSSRRGPAGWLLIAALTVLILALALGLLAL